MLEKIRKILHWKINREPQFPLKFYETREDRYNVSYQNVHICTCKDSQRKEVQDYFDEHYTGDNLLEISDVLKEKYNLKIQRGKSYPKGKGKGRKSKKANYKTARLCFNETPSGRLQVKVRDKGKSQHICSCYPSEKEEVARKYHMLKKNNNLETIKIILKEEYNLR